MSCFILHPDSIRKIGYTLAEILNACKYRNYYTFDKGAAKSANLPKLLAQYDRPLYGYDPEAISEALHRLNAKAYAGRYSDPDEETFAPPANMRYNLRPLAGVTNTPQEWHYHLASLLDCYLYQTDEDTTHADPLRQALETFSAHLAAGIVRNSEQYNKYRWGE